jgi:hypothetical protein
MMEQSFNKGIIYESSIPLKDSFQMITAESTFNSTVYSSPKKRIVGQGSIISCMGHFVVKKKLQTTQSVIQPHGSCKRCTQVLRR